MSQYFGCIHQHTKLKDLANLMKFDEFDEKLCLINGTRL